ncbi:hypothetical protein MWU78_10435 [Arenibacter sp. F26102]|uniref:hypothetical protein n=1 Tax=Arenibacter sp. F26102 TaxID=2926416 RepID=UPI001FF14C86|nr:hypothetical protein [Arenibacter sp. F26102]MCK0146062.1 hypothetical protein [Arenibacter sp. F26102]
MKGFVGLITLLIILNCNNKSEDDALDCLNVACTEEYRTITISVKDQKGKVVVLDEFEVVVLPKGADITPDTASGDYEWMTINGVYPLISDKYSMEYRDKKIEINFKGYVEDRLVVDSDYTVGADCCHVLLFEGETDVVINNL